MTDERLKIDRTVPVSREDYDRMADQRDEFRKLAYRLKAQLGYARSSLADALQLAETLAAGTCSCPEEAWFELTQGLDSARWTAQAALDQCPKLTG